MASLISVLVGTSTVLHWAAGLMLVAAAFLVLARLTRGPSSLDRSIATDVLVAIIVAAVGLYLALTDAESVLPILVVLSLLGFTAPVAIARLIASRSALLRDLAPRPGKGARRHEPTLAPSATATEGEDS